jgi:hypothetical protein
MVKNEKTIQCQDHLTLGHKWTIQSGFDNRMPDIRKTGLEIHPFFLSLSLGQQSKTGSKTEWHPADSCGQFKYTGLAWFSNGYCSHFPLYV